MLVDLLFFLVAAVLVYLIIKRTTSKKQQEATGLREEGEGAARVTGNDGPGWVRQQQQREQERARGGRVQGDEQQSQQQENRQGEDNDDEAGRNLKKQRRKEERKQRQEYVQEMIRTKAEKYDKYREEQERLEREEEQKQRKEQEYLEKIAEEDRKKKQEEYNKWKDFFVVESSGTDKKSEEEEKAELEAFNASMLKYIREHKMCLLQQMSHQFKLSTKEIVDKIKEFEGRGELNGVFDERGKYIEVTAEEWHGIINYMRANGRVTKADMMSECARIVKVQGSSQDADSNLLDLIDKEAETLTA